MRVTLDLVGPAEADVLRVLRRLLKRLLRDSGVVCKAIAEVKPCR